MLEFLLLKNKFILFALLGLVVNLYLPSQSFANNAESGSFSNFKLSVELRTTQISLKKAYLLAMNDKDRVVVEKDSLKREIISGKSPKVCFFVAFFPGFAIHGLGHYYIGENKTGTILLATEGISILSFLSGLYSSMGEIDNPGKSDAPEVLGVIGIGLFLGSWVYDFIGAPKKARRMQQNHTVMIYPSIGEKRFVINFAFNR